MEAKGLSNEIFNVGCMYWNYEPVTLDEILKIKETSEVQNDSKLQAVVQADD